MQIRSKGSMRSDNIRHTQPACAPCGIRGGKTIQPVHMDDVKGLDLSIDEVCKGQRNLQCTHLYGKVVNLHRSGTNDLRTCWTQTPTRVIAVRGANRHIVARLSLCACQGLEHRHRTAKPRREGLYNVKDSHDGSADSKRSS